MFQTTNQNWSYPLFWCFKAIFDELVKKIRVVRGVYNMPWEFVLHGERQDCTPSGHPRKEG
jgi:hypothetical protein